MVRRQLKQDVLDQIKGRTSIMGAIAEAVAVTNNTPEPSPSTMVRWIAGNHPMISSDASLEAISKKLGIPVLDLYEEAEMSDTTTVL